MFFKVIVFVLLAVMAYATPLPQYGGVGAIGTGYVGGFGGGFGGGYGGNSFGYGGHRVAVGGVGYVGGAAGAVGAVGHHVYGK